MKSFYIKIIVIGFSLILFSGVSYAKSNIKMHADVNDDFTIMYKDLPNEIQLKVTEAQTVPSIINIPENSTITLEVIRAQRELRWHKGGLILCKLKSYTLQDCSVPLDVQDKNIYLTIRKYEEIDKKEAWILGTELVLAQGASVFAPGVDIGYFFIKGAIQRKKHPHWFKAGVRNAYDNSIFWFPQKGKPIELTDGDQVKIKDIKPEKVDKLIEKIDKRNARFERQAAHRIEKKEKKALKRELKHEKKLVNCSVVENAIENEVVEKDVHAEIAETETTVKKDVETEIQEQIEE